MARGRMIASTVADDKRECLQSRAIRGMMFSSEQVLETHGIANYTDGFFMPVNCIPVRRKVRRSSIMLRGTSVLATWVSSLDERRTLRVQETNSMQRITGIEGGYIYIARSNSNTWKIGCTREKAGYVHSLPSKGSLAGVHARLRSLRKKTGTPFELIHVIYIPKNLMQFEHELHTVFDAYRCSKSELFALPDDALDVIKSITAYAGDAVSHLGGI